MRIGKASASPPTFVCVCILRLLSTNNKWIRLIGALQARLPIADDARRARVNEIMLAKFLRYLHQPLSAFDVDLEHDLSRRVESRTRSMDNYFWLDLLENSAKSAIVRQVCEMVGHIVDRLSWVRDIDRMQSRSFACRDLPEDLVCQATRTTRNKHSAKAAVHQHDRLWLSTLR